MLSLVVLLRLWWLWRSMWIADISVLLHPIIKARMRGLILGSAKMRNSMNM